VLFASASALDDYHDHARRLVRGIDHGDLPDGIVTNYVVAETLNLINEKLGPATANEMLGRLIEGAHFEISRPPNVDFDAAQPLFRQYGALSFVDATLAAYMDRAGIEYLYSFDDDFDVLDGRARLDTADNPFTE
jgi:predicted nucleic acid-binding protein